MDYATFLSERAKRRRIPALRKLYPLMAVEGMISLGGGNPNPSLFPFSGAEFEIVDELGNKIKLKADPAVFRSSLEYNDTEGLKPLVARLRQLTLSEHAPLVDFALTITPGSQQSLNSLFETLLNPSDTVIVESPSYAGAFAAIDAIGCNYLPVAIDNEGLQPDVLDAALTAWDVGTRGSKPKLLYIIPTGANPTGTTMSLQRKMAIYSVAQSHNLLVVEDEAYYYMQFTAAARGRIPSFLSIDTDGRVIRTDSFSKIISSGIRLGFTVGPKAIIERVTMANQSQLICTSGMSQVALLALFEHWHVGDAEDWGHGVGLGLMESHLKRVNAFYQAQCEAFVAAATRILRVGTPTQLVSFHCIPKSGMFVWLRLLNVADSYQLTSEGAVAKKVLLVPGAVFYPGGELERAHCPYARACFSTATPEQIETALERLRSLLED